MLFRSTGKVLDAADASGSDHSLSQHAAAGMSYIDTKTGEEGIDFLADFEKADSTEKPDKHTQMEILNLLLKLRQELDLSIIFISHDLALVQKLCNKILIMYRGKIIERGLTSEILKNPQEEYTKELINICS